MYLAEVRALTAAVLLLTGDSASTYQSEDLDIEQSGVRCVLLAQLHGDQAVHSETRQSAGLHD